MDQLTEQQKLDLASLQVYSLEVAKVPSSLYDTVNFKFLTEQLVLNTQASQQAINDLIGSAPSSLNTLKEIADSLANNPSLSATLLQSISNVQVALDTEISNRSTAGATTNSTVSSLVADNTQNKLDILFNTEKYWQLKDASESQLNGLSIVTEQSFINVREEIQQASDGFNTDLLAEAAFRLQQDTNLSSSIQLLQTNTTFNIASIQVNTKAIEDETKARIDGEQETQRVFNEELGVISSQVTANYEEGQQSLTQEKTDRATRDNELDQSISDLRSQLEDSSGSSSIKFDELKIEVESEALQRQGQFESIQGSVNRIDLEKFDKSDAFEKRPDGSFQVNSYLYISDTWRLSASNSQSASKRLVFEHLDSVTQTWSTAVPFIRA